MLRIQFALWRRDVATRRLERIRDGRRAYSAGAQKMLEQRIERWNAIASLLIEER